MNTGTGIAIAIGLYALSQQKAQTKPATNPPGQQPKPSQQASSGSSKGTGAPAGQGGGSTAGRGGSAKTGGGTNAGNSIEDAFGTFENLNAPSVIDGMFQEFNNQPDIVPDFTFFQAPPDLAQISDLAAAPTGVPQFGGDPSFEIDPNTGLVINPDTGLPFGSDAPDVVDLTDQVNQGSVIDAGDPGEVPVPIFDVPEDDSF